MARPPRKCRAAQPMQGERRTRQRPQRQRHQQQLVVVARDAVHADHAAPLAAVQNRPLAVGSGCRSPSAPSARGRPTAGRRSSSPRAGSTGNADSGFGAPCPERFREWRVRNGTQESRRGCRRPAKQSRVMGIKLQQTGGENRKPRAGPDPVERGSAAACGEPGPVGSPEATRRPAFRRGALADSELGGLHASVFPCHH
jgi:hypothetical protein